METSQFPDMVEYRHDELENDAEWKAGLGSLTVLNGADGDIRAYMVHYGLTIPDSHHLILTENNTFDPDSSKLLNVPIDCRKRDNDFKVSYTGVGNNAASRAKTKIKHCGWFMANNEKFCPLVDLTADRAVVDPASGETIRPRIWQTCHQECEEYTHCTLHND